MERLLFLQPIPKEELLAKAGFLNNLTEVLVENYFLFNFQKKLMTVEFKKKEYVCFDVREQKVSLWPILLDRNNQMVYG